MKTRIYCISLILACAICAISFADTIQTKDGSVIVGEVIHLDQGKVTIKTQFAGELTIPWDQVASIETEQTKPIHLSDGSVIVGTVSKTDTDALEVKRETSQTVFSVNAADIAAIDPPPPPAPPTPTPIQWHGSIVGSLSITEGNTDTKGAGVSADLNRRRDDDRITLKGGYYYTENDSDATRDDQFLSGKYDYFFTKKLFGYLNSRLDRDEIKDLRLRSTGGLGLGYQWIETEIYNFFGEGGLSYVNEDFKLDVDDETYAAGRAAYHFDWWLIKDLLQFNHNTEFLLGFEDTEDWLAISDGSLMWKWTDRWSFNAGVRFEYDNTPATGRKSADWKYNVGVGYSF